MKQIPTILTKTGLFASLIIGLFACTPKQPVVEAPENTIKPEVARALQRNYIVTRAQILRDTFKYEDVRDVTFTLKEVKQYIQYIEQELGPEKAAETSLRVYFAAYPPSPGFEFGKSTVFMAPVLPEPKQQGALFMLMQNNEIPPLNKGTGGHPPNNY